MSMWVEDVYGYFELVRCLNSDIQIPLEKQFPVERFEAAVSQSTVPRAPLDRTTPILNSSYSSVSSCLNLDIQFPVEQFEAAASQSAVPPS